MVYYQAMMQALECTAKVKCTYATVCNANGRQLFTVQSARVQDDLIQAKYTEAIWVGSRIPATASDQLLDIMQQYYTEYVAAGKITGEQTDTFDGTTGYLNKNGKALRDFLASGETTVYVYPHQWNWTPVQTTKVTTIKKQNNLAWLIAAGSTLFE